MSLGAQGSDSATETAVRNAISSGVTFAIASGNSNLDACNFTPARVAEAITVNASDINDAQASFSNFGSCTDIFGPGVNITSSWNTSDTATNTISGTSMATPHTTGVAALWLAAHPTDSPAAVSTPFVTNVATSSEPAPGVAAVVGVVAADTPNATIANMPTTGSIRIRPIGNSPGSSGPQCNVIGPDDDRDTLLRADVRVPLWSVHSTRWRSSCAVPGPPVTTHRTRVVPGRGRVRG
ncbi:S8 family serine peptidase [Kibdelosporangium lantanae]|uniref:S8 family serine peptidase n=1 Tax=Kibdelosporangium lantanae TaxID=1497396 RepID=A0ABW3MBI3_9PSEU